MKTVDDFQGFRRGELAVTNVLPSTRRSSWFWIHLFSVEEKRLARLATPSTEASNKDHPPRR